MLSKIKTILVILLLYLCLSQQIKLEEAYSYNDTVFRAFQVCVATKDKIRTGL